MKFVSKVKECSILDRIRNEEIRSELKTNNIHDDVLEPLKGTCGKNTMRRILKVDHAEILEYKRTE